jgi:hypothetical protein
MECPHLLKVFRGLIRLLRGGEHDTEIMKNSQVRVEQ